MKAWTASTSSRAGVVVELEAARQARGSSRGLRHARRSAPRRAAPAASSTCSGPIVSGGSSRTVSGAGRVEHEPLLEQRPAHDARARRRRAGRRASGRARAPRRRAAARAGAPRSASPSSRTRAQQRLVVGHVERREGRGARDRAAGEGRAVVAGPSTSASRSPVTSAPIGRPPPSALATVIASGTTPACS